MIICWDNLGYKKVIPFGGNIKGIMYHGERPNRIELTLHEILNSNYIASEQLVSYLYQLILVTSHNNRDQIKISTSLKDVYKEEPENKIKMGIKKRELMIL